MQLKKCFLCIPCLLPAAILLGCAGQVPPGGGPIDAIPPAIVHTKPDSNATHMETKTIELEFSEYVDRRTVEESIFISPFLGELEFDWGTTDVRVKFGQSLRKNTTYVVNVGTDVKDLRAGNRMASGFTLAFSTGDSIDRGILSGRVFDEKPEGVMIFAYALANYNPDTLDPSKVKPDYIMQTGKNGLFVLSHLAFGRYRLIAVRDEYHNLFYDRQVDQFGVTVGDTAVTAGIPAIDGLWFRLSVEDTSKPFLTGVQLVNNRHVQARFSEAIDSISFVSAQFKIVDTLSGNSVPIILADRNSLFPMVVDLLMEFVLDSGVGFRLTARSILDRSGNPLDSANGSLLFSGTATTDTVRPVPRVSSITDSAKGVPLDKKFIVAFSEPVLHRPLANVIQLTDGLRSEVRTSLRWLNSTDVLMVPERPLESKVWYQIRVVLDSVRDYSGNGWKDSLWTVHFQSLDLRTTGSIEGVIVDKRENKSDGPIYLTAHSTDLNPSQSITLRLPKAGAFAFEQLPEGKYTFSAFRDDDSSRSYSFGKPFPFVPSERFIVSTDTVKVRARWGVEGVGLQFR